MPTELQGLSVLVCCYNSELNLPKTLHHLSRQVLVPSIPWEIVAVDNCSTDTTYQLLIDFKATNTELDILVLTEAMPGKTKAMETGFKSLKYSLVVVCDDDNWLAEDYLQKAIDIMTNKPEVGIAGGFCFPVFGGPEPFWIKNYIGGYACEFEPRESGYYKMVFGAGMVIRKNVLDMIYHSGFNSLLSSLRGKVMRTGEDAEHCKIFDLIGYKIWYDNELRLQHFIPPGKLSWEYTKKLFAAFGQSNVLLQLYDKVSNSDIPEKLPLFFWLKKFLYFLLVQIWYYPKYREELKRDEGEGAAVLYLSWNLQMWEYLRLNWSLNRYYNRIIALRSRIVKEQNK